MGLIKNKSRIVHNEQRMQLGNVVASLLFSRQFKIVTICAFFVWSTGYRFAVLFYCSCKLIPKSIKSRFIQKPLYIIFNASNTIHQRLSNVDLQRSTPILANVGLVVWMWFNVIHNSMFELIFF